MSICFKDELKLTKGGSNKLHSHIIYIECHVMS